MGVKNHILITGINGFIANSIKESINSEKYEVWGLTRRNNKSKKNFKVDLLDGKRLKEISDKLPFFSLIIHTAAIAHNQKLHKGQSVYFNNVNITKNLINVFEKKS